MSSIGEDLLIYLKAYNAEDHAKLTQSDDVPESLIMAIYNKHKTYFEAWRKVPAEFRDASGRVPEELMKKALNGETINENTVSKNNQIPTKLAADMVAAGIMFSDADIMFITKNATQIAMLGYGLDAAKTLATDKVVRQKISEKIKTGAPLSETEKKLWRKTRENDAQTIEEDWKIHQPERYAIHIMKKLDSGKIPLEQALPEIEKYLGKTANLNRADNLYAELQRQQTRLVKMSDETKSAISALLKKNGLEHVLSTNMTERDKMGALRGTINQKAKAVKKTHLSRNMLLNRSTNSKT